MTAAPTKQLSTRSVRHLGIALRNKDSGPRFGSDPKELERVKEKWVREETRRRRVRCKMPLLPRRPKRWRMIAATSRVTFYYLVAKNLGKLQTL